MAFPSPKTEDALLVLEALTLDYGQVRALKQIDFSIEYSTIHAIVGEHGAGKSSLAAILCGLIKPQSGLISFNGQEYRFFSINSAYQAGIRVVHQHALSVNEHFTVAENLFLTNGPFVENMKWRYRIYHAARQFLQENDIDIDPITLAQNLNLSDRILIDILKQIYSRPKLLILDEALEKLSSVSFKKVVGLLSRLKARGASILLITHRIDDIYELADRVSVIKNGEILVTDHVRNIDKLNLIKMAYIQISAEENVENLNREFYQLLKYNEAILRHLPVNLIVMDDAHRIKMVNDYCKQNFALTKSSYFNLPLEQLLSSANAEVMNLIKSADPVETTFYQIPLTLNAMPMTGNLKLFPIYDGKLLIGVIIIIEDVSEFDRLQKQVILSEKLASVGLLAAGVAHEINNPLEIIYTYLSFMKYKFRTPEFHEALDTLHEQIEHIATIVSNLLSFSEKNSIVNEEIELNGELRNTLKLIKHNASYQHITIKFEPCEQDLIVRVNRHEIKQVILNLLKNSFEAMPSGGQISIRTALIPENGGQNVQMIFHDTGPGIADENPNNIFLPFYSTKKGGENNLGLGLAVSYSIIQKYHGAMTVQNLEQAGCQFVITLPQSY